jgi:anthranilate synthase/aminodeoxychorismate synthase-like glutamine amidotransferase
MILVIDNYDSFTFNLVQYLGELGTKLSVFRNDAITINQIEKMRPTHIVISPGPGRPEEAGISIEVVQKFAGVIPILGVCLGHQAIVAAYGGRIVGAGELVHGKTSEIYHDGKTIFDGVKSPFLATRYHSLIADRKTLPSCLEISAETKEGLIMGVRHKFHRVEGVQFHPESILTTVGKEILANFLGLEAASIKVGESA